MHVDNNNCAGQDGVFAMRMISAHAGDVIATELAVALWNNFKVDF